MATHLLAALTAQDRTSKQGVILEALSRCSLWCRLTGLRMLFAGYTPPVALYVLLSELTSTLLLFISTYPCIFVQGRIACRLGTVDHLQYWYTLLAGRHDNSHKRASSTTVTGRKR